MFKCSNGQMFKWSNVPMFKYSKVQIFKYLIIQIFKYSNVQMFKCSNVKCQMSKVKSQISNVNKVRILSELTSEVPPVIFDNCLSANSRNSTKAMNKHRCFQ